MIDDENNSIEADWLLATYGLSFCRFSQKIPESAWKFGGVGEIDWDLACIDSMYALLTIFIFAVYLAAQAHSSGWLIAPESDQR